MLYHFIFLLATIYTAERRAKRFKSDDSLQLSELNMSFTTEMDIEEYHRKFQVSSENKIKYKNAYDSMVKEFVKTYLKSHNFYSKEDDKSEYKLEINIPENYDLSTMVNFCNEKKESLIKDIVIINAVDEFEFECAYNLFVEFAIFAMDKIQKVHEMRSNIKNDLEFRKLLIEDTTLLENFIMSINWFNQLTDIQFEFSLLHNFEKIDPKGCNEQKNMSLFITYVFYNELEMSYTYNDVRDESINILVYEYKTNWSKTNKEIIEFETTENMQKFLKEKLSEERAKRTKHEAKIATRACIMMRCFATKINYNGILAFYNNINQTKKVIYCSGFRLFCIRFDESKTNRNVLKMKLIFQDIYYTHIIVRTSTLSSINDVRIIHLKAFLDQFLVKINANIANIYKRIINKYFDDLIIKHGENADKKIEMINNQIKNIKDTIIEQEKEKNYEIKIFAAKKLKEIQLEKEKNLKSKKEKIDELEKEKKDCLIDLFAMIGPSRNSLIKNMYDQWENVYITTLYSHQLDEAHKTIYDKISKFGMENTQIYFSTIRKEKTRNLERCLNELINSIKSLCIHQKKISEEYEKTIDDKDNILKNTLNMLCEDNPLFKNVTNEIAQKISIRENKDIAADIISRLNTHIKSNTQIKELIDRNMTTINKYIENNIELKGLINEVEENAIKLIEIYKSKFQK